MDGEEEYMSAICTGCGIDSEKTGEYTEDNPVKDDGTYEDLCVSGHLAKCNCGKQMFFPYNPNLNPSEIEDTKEKS